MYRRHSRLRQPYELVPEHVQQRAGAGSRRNNIIKRQLGHRIFEREFEFRRRELVSPQFTYVPRFDSSV